MNVPVTMRDGVRLATDLYLPDAEGRFPVVLVRTPCGSETQGFAEQGRFYAARGYVFVVQDTRGKYDSEGEWYGRRSERDDGDDTITWLGTQARSSGDVGMVGASCGGLVQMMVAPAGNPHLRALIPEVTPVTLGRTPEAYRRLAVYGRGNSAPSELSWLVTTDGRVNPACETEWRVAEQTVFHDRERPSHVVVPLKPIGQSQGWPSVLHSDQRLLLLTSPPPRRDRARRARPSSPRTLRPSRSRARR